MNDLIVAHTQNSLPLQYLLESIQIRGGRVTHSQTADKNLLELSIPIPGKTNTSITVHHAFDAELAPADVVRALCDAQSVLDAVNLAKLYEP